MSPACFPGAGNSRTASGLFHLNASVATSPMILAIVSSLVSPASGTVSTPPAQTAEYAKIESRLYVPSVHRRVSTASSKTGIINPEYPYIWIEAELPRQFVYSPQYPQCLPATRLRTTR